MILEYRDCKEEGSCCRRGTSSKDYDSSHPELIHGNIRLSSGRFIGSDEVQAELERVAKSLRKHL